MSARTTSNSYDAVIVGARCAGAATAMLLARRGARVLVVDHDMPGTDTMSTHALMRGAVMQLHRWRVLDRIRATGAPRIRRTSFYYGEEAVDVDITPAHGTDALFAPRRYILDAALVDAARSAGAEFRFETGCTGLEKDRDGRVSGLRLTSRQGRNEVVRAGIVIGADGRRSVVARRIAAPVEREAHNVSAVSYGYFSGLGNHGYRWFWDDGVAGGIIPTNHGESCVFLSMSAQDFGAPLLSRKPDAFLSTIAAKMPAMNAAMTGARLARNLAVFRGTPGYVRKSQGPGWALVGDAGYFKDPITAHGITDALRDAEILADAIIAGRPEVYPDARDALCGEFFRLTDEIAGYRWNMDELKTLHVALNRAMKTTQTWIAGSAGSVSQAA